MNNKKKVKRILCLLLIAVIAGSLLSGCGTKEGTGGNANSDKDKVKKVEFPIIADGTTEYVIVRGENASSTEIYAAEELQKYLRIISGVKVPIVTDSSETVQKEIVVGKTNRETEGTFDREELGEDGLLIKAKDSKLWLIGGGDRGTIYSVYTFLEEYLGCRFFTEYVEQIPEMETVLVEETDEDKQIPQFMYRDVAWTEYMGESISVKRKLNAAVWGRELSDKVGGGLSFAEGVGGHTFELFISPQEYFSEHPEYFTMNKDGERISNGQLCLTNPDVLKLVVSGVRDWLESDPEAKIVSISQNDRQDPCLCPDCSKVYEEGGGAYSEGLIRFVNAVAAELEGDYPNVLFDTYAYNYTRSVPKTKPADNVLVRLCTIECCFSHPHEEECDNHYTASYVNGTANTFAKDLEDWSKLCGGNLWIYDYNCNFSFTSMTFPDFDNLSENYRWYAKNGAVGIMPEGQWKTPTVGFAELRSYLLSKLAWNPYMSEEEYYTHMDEFVEGVYGPGGKYIRQYIELAQELTEELHFSIGMETDIYTMYPVEAITNHKADEIPKDITVEMVKNYTKTDWTEYWNWYSDVKENRITSEGEILFEKAMKAAETESQRQDIEKISLQIKYLKSYYYAQQLSQGEGTLRMLINSFIKEHESDFTANEKESLPSAIEELAHTQCLEAYAKFNKELANQMVDWGVVYGDSGKAMADYLNFDYTTMPALWQSKGGQEKPALKEASGELAKITVTGPPVTKFRKLELGVSQFSNAVNYGFDVAVPKGLEGKSYLYAPINRTEIKITVKEDGWVYVLTQALWGLRVPLKKQGFTAIETYEQGTLSTAHNIVPLVLMGKEVKAGETIKFYTDQFGIVIAEETTE